MEHSWHFFSVFWFYPLWDWNKLPDSYRDSAYLSTDTSSLNTFFDDTTGSEVEKISQEEPEPVEEEEHSQDEIPKLQAIINVSYWYSLSLSAMEVRLPLADTVGWQQ